MSTGKLSVEELRISMQRFGTIDYLVFILMLCMCSVIGVYWGFKKKQNKEDYLMGNRNMQVFPISMSLVASFISGIFLIGNPTEVYVYGLQIIYKLIGISIMCYILVKVFLPIYQELKLTSSYEYLEYRFDKRIRLFGSVLFAILMITWLPLVIYVPALVFNHVSGINIHVITPVVCGVCIFYTCLGGIKAVVWTDFIQIMIMIGSLLVVVIVGTYDVGGISVVIDRNLQSGRIEAPIWDIDPTTRHTIWGLAFGGSFGWLASAATSQSMIQRYLSLPNIKAAKRAALYFYICTTLLLCTAFYAGLLIYAKYYDCDPLTTKLAKVKDQLLLLYVMDILGKLPGFPGLFIAGVFSAALSSLSTGLNSMAAVALEDFYKPFAKHPLTEKQMGIFLKSVVLILGIIATSLVFVVEKLGTVLQLSMSLNALSKGPCLGIFLSGLFIPKIHSTGVLIGGISGFLLNVWVYINSLSQKFTYLQKPVSTEGCTYTFSSNSTIINHITSNITHSQHHDDIFVLYRISYVWYAFLGTVVTMTIALLVSTVWNPIKSSDTDPKFLAHVIRKYYENNKSSEMEKNALEKSMIPLCIIDPNDAQSMKK